MRGCSVAAVSPPQIASTPFRTSSSNNEAYTCVVFGCYAPTGAA